jgi:hypothetical protein
MGCPSACGHYLLYSNHGSGAIDTLSTWKTFNAGQISFDTTLTDGTWKFSIRLESSDGRKSPLSYASVILDDDAPDLIYGETVAEMPPSGCCSRNRQI